MVIGVGIEMQSINVEFKAWPKIPRDNPFNVTITEKIDGTNACIIIHDGEIVGVQSRNRLIYPEGTEGKPKGCDNAGFALWVKNNTNDLLSLGDGYHYGEWAGESIQNNPHLIVGKKFFLFNTQRWNENNPNRPTCCDVVPVLFQGIMKLATVPELLCRMQLDAGDTKPEGVIVYYHAHRSYTKHTIESPNGKWCK